MTDNKDKPIDLSSIENFEIEPSWVKKGSDSKYNNYSERKEYSGGKVKKRERGSGQLNSRKPKYTKDNNQPKDETIFEFQILPRREILEKIKTEMRKTGISYSLTDICETISAKGERCSVRIRFKDNKEKDFTRTVVDNMVFTTKEEAVDHLLRNNFDQCFTKELDEEEKPIKTFNYMLQCPRTEFLLPPNSYHRYEEIIKQHILLNSINEEYEKYCDGLIKVIEPDKIKLWCEKNIKIYKFSIKGEDNWFKGIDQLRANLIREVPRSLFVKESVIKIKGNELHFLENKIKKQFERYYNFKSNWIKHLFSVCVMNLRKSNFYLFKFSEKKNTYACAFKRNKVDGKKLSKNAQRILSLIKESKEIKKAKFLKEVNLKDIEPKEILRELKWMVTEGYITEFSSGVIKAN